jgi:hypothetical protein
MQSGNGNSNGWVLEFAIESARIPDPLMGWSSSGDTKSQVRLEFDDHLLAIAYAQKHGIAFRLIECETPPKIIKAYADNFATSRRNSWTH